jgi:hypothetical protein
MKETRIGRLLGACLHQAISDTLPDRLEFYELWLRSKAWRDGSLGLAPMTAVLGFLRTEDQYHHIMDRAGRLAAEWTMASMSPVRRRVIALLPRPLRAKAGLRLAAGIVRDVCSASQATMRFHRTSAQLNVADSLFCTVREPQKLPLCDFYSALAVETLSNLGLPAHGRIEACHAVHGPSCVIAVDFSGKDDAGEPAVEG